MDSTSIDQELGATERRKKWVRTQKSTFQKSFKQNSTYISVDEKDNQKPSKQITKNGFSDFLTRSLCNAEFGCKEMELVDEEMIGLVSLRRKAEIDKPLTGAFIAGCTHVNAQTAVLIETLIRLGAQVRWCACNIYSTHDHVAAALANNNIPVYAWSNETDEDFWWCISQVIRPDDVSWVPNLILDEGGDLTHYMQKSYPDIFQSLKGIIEESEPGLERLFQLSKNKLLDVPAINICDSFVKRKFDNLYMAKESIVESLKSCVDVMLGGKSILVCGYGDVGKGCCQALRSMGSFIYVTEVDPICAMQACLDGFKVVRIDEVIRLVDILITATGSKAIVTLSHVEKMKSGAILCNMGHSNTEINMSLNGFYHPDVKWEELKENVCQLTLKNNKKIFLLAKGQTLNYRCSNIPSLVTSVTSCAQVLALIELNNSKGRYKPEVYLLPKKLDEYVASLHLPVFDAHLTELSEDQCDYLGLNKNGPFKSQNYKY